MAFSLSNDFDSLEAFLSARAPHQPEFHQAVIEVMEDILPIIEGSEPYKSANLFERLVEPERVISFQVVWDNDKGGVEVNRGCRVQFNSAIGPYKGGLRFHPTVNTSVLKFLGFEQTFKNALTGLPMGGGKGGSDFDPRGRSDGEVMRFCNAFMRELHRHIGTDVDIPAGDINVGAREIGYLFGAFRRITNSFDGVLTGKGLGYGGSPLRIEATGYGVVYFLDQMLRVRDESLEGKRLVVSGAGNVSIHVAEKGMQLGAKVICLSDSSGTVHDAEGFDQRKLDWVKKHKEQTRASLEPYVSEFGGEWLAGERPWKLEGDVALPCATQNELDGADAEALVENGFSAVVEGANMPCTSAARRVFSKSKTLFAPGKAANAGGVAVSGLEISQNRHRRTSDRETIDTELQRVMRHVHRQCVEEGTHDGVIDYSRGANIAGLRKVADAMIAQGRG